MAQYLVTGGAGFIGSNIAERLLKAGHAVRIIDDYSTGRPENIDALRDRIDFIQGSLCDVDYAAEAVRDVDYVLHLAARPSVPASVEDPRSCHEANIDGTFNLLMAARDARVKRVVYSASSSAYGDTLKLPNQEDFAPRPLSPYAVAKLAGEYYCKVFTEIYGLECVSLRYFNVFGPRQNPASQYSAVIPKFITSLLSGEAPTIFGDGEQTRDFTFVENVYLGNMLACTASGAPGHVINLACGTPISVNKLVDLLNGIIGTRIRPRYEPARPGDVKHSAADVAKARTILNFQPTVDLRAGLEQTVEWYKTKK